MTRDMDYIRKLLLEIEAAPADRPWSTESDHGSPRNAELYRTLQLLEGAGFIEVGHHAAYHGGGELWLNVTLSWEGHDFLDAVRSEAVWAKTKEKVASTVGTTSLAVLKEVAGAVARSILGLP